MSGFLRRLGALLLTMILVSFLTYAAFELISGDPAQIILGTQATPERLAALRRELGLDLPFWQRYLNWLKGFFTGDLGTSYSYRQPVWTLIAPKVRVTLCMCFLSFLMITVISIPVGIRSARQTEGAAVWIRTAVNQLCMSVPPFFTGILVSFFFGITLRLFIPGDFPGLEKDLPGSLKYLFFAAVCLSVPRIAMTVRMMRSTVTGEMEKDYVRTAIARGNDRPGVLYVHVLRNALVPAISFLAQTMAEIVAGGIVIEQVFGIPGLGRLLVASIAGRDYPVVQAIVVILAFWVVMAGTVADLISQWIDPRLRLGQGH